MELEYSKNIEIKYAVDVFVAGGGPSGVAAAVSAARQGTKVYLAERSECFGGAGTLSKVPAFMRFSDGVNFLSGGIGREIFDKLYDENTDYRIIEFSINTEKLKRIYDEMMIESGALFTFETTLLDVICENGKISYAILQGKENIFAVKAKIFIDATGNGSMAVFAGADSEKGDFEGHMMPATLCSLWGDIDWSRAIVELGKDPDNRNLSKAFEDNVFTVKDPSLPGMWRFSKNYGGGNIGHVFGVDGTDEVSVTQAMIEARKRMGEYVNYYNHYLDGYENATLLSTGDVLGIRETRRVVCDYMATKDDYLNHTIFDDEIGRYCYPIDIHRYSIDSNENGDKIYAQGYEKGKSYGISYKSLLPKGISNLLVTGRCIGANRSMMGSIRVMPACYITGMAGGIAASRAIIENTDLRNINVKKMQEVLIENGAFINKKRR